MAASSTTMMIGRQAFDTLNIMSKPFPSSSDAVLLPQLNLQAPSCMNGSQTILKMAGETQLKHLDRREREHDDMVIHPFALGKITKDRRIFSQDFTIRSCHIGPNHTATIETVMNLLQETVLNHFRSIGLLKFGLESTPEMSGRNLIWVMSKMHVVVDHYPSWGDDIRVDNWFIPSRKNGHGTEWVICDRWTGQTLARATSMLLMMNKETRKLSEMPEGDKRKIEPQYIECPPILDVDGSRIRKLDHTKMEYVRTGLTPRWNDLDANQHVNNSNYIGFMLESVPVSFLKSHDLLSATLEYRRECAVDDVLQSLTSICHETIDGSIGSGGDDECFHLLRFESGVIVARGRTKWRPKHANKIKT